MHTETGSTSKYLRILSDSSQAGQVGDVLEQGLAVLLGSDTAVSVQVLKSSSSAMQAMWEKLAVNAILNPICTIFNVSNGALVEERFSELRRHIAAEIDMVASAHGVTIPGGAELAALAVARSTAENKCSMLADVQRGLKTEVDVINGYVVNEGEKLGLQTPVNKHMQALVHALHQPKLDINFTAPASIPVFTTVAEMRQARQQYQGRVGFVPTMGGLHDGHLRLIQACREQCDHVVVSIFVNGSQFAAHEDFDKYPRNHEQDVQTLLDNAPVDAVFAPTSSEIYPNDPRGLKLRTRIEPLDILSEPEALVRPGFFGGVATICASLFNIVQPDVVAFGQKDALQCAVIQNLVEDLHMPIDVVIVDTVRDVSGLARSTRNKYLTPLLTQQAPVIPAALQQAADALQCNRSLVESKELLHQSLLAEPLVSEVEYVSIAHRRTGRELQDLSFGSEGSEAVISCAVRMKDAHVEVRLIDNVCVQL